MRQQRWRQVATLVAAAIVLSACGGSEPGAEDGAGADDAPVTGADGIPEEGGPDAGSVTFAHSAGVPQIVKLPQAMAVAGLAELGYETAEESFQTTTDSIQAVIRGDAQLGNTAPANFLAAVAEGADLVAVIGGGRPDFFMVGRDGVESVCDDAVRVGINNPISTTDQLVRMELDQCDGSGPEKEILAVPLTSNRVEALLAGELDAAPAQFASVPQIERLHADDLVFISNMAEDYPTIISTITFTTRQVLEERPRLIYDFIAQQTEAVTAAYDDPSAMVEFALETVEVVAEEDMAAAVQAYLDNEVFPVDGGLSEREVADTYQSLVDTGILETEFDPETAVDRSLLELVLDERG